MFKVCKEKQSFEKPKQETHENDNRRNDENFEGNEKLTVTRKKFYKKN